MKDAVRKDELLNTGLLGRRSAGFADHAVDGLRWFGTDGEPLVHFGKIDFVVGSLDERVVGAELFDITTIATFAAVDGNDFVIRAILGALAVETERD